MLDLRPADSRHLAYVNPVRAGDHPDPSVIRVGERDFWLATTSTNWSPAFPVLHSTNLVDWTVEGSVFAERPEWSKGDFWAPEMSEYNGRYFVYYVGRGQDNRLTIAVATADRPQGPYIDHGPLLNQSDGSIDPMAFVDHNGDRYLFWKEDGNSAGNPTTIWVARLSDDGLTVVSEPTQVMYNDAPWEGDVVEAPFVLRRDEWYYLFYSGNACCGHACRYAMGVARARSVTGPWEKYEANPILSSNERWRCPGHGSIVDTADGRSYLIYHAYAAGEEPRSVGRQMLLDEVTWGVDGWPQINAHLGPSAIAPSPFGTRLRPRADTIVDDFSGPHLDFNWQWPFNVSPTVQLDGAGLILAPQENAGDPVLGALIGRNSLLEDFLATTEIDLQSCSPGTAAGLGAVGDPQNALGIAYTGGELITWRRRNGRHRELARALVTNTGRLRLRLLVAGGTEYRLAYAVEEGHWQDLGPSINGAYLPPWDAGVRISLTAGGPQARPRFLGYKVEPFVPNVRYIQPRHLRQSTMQSVPSIAQARNASGL